MQQLSDLQTQVQIATLVRSGLLADPLVVGAQLANPEAALLATEQWLRTLDHPQWRKITASLRKGLQAQMAVQQMEMAAQAAAEEAAQAQMAGGAPSPSTGAPAGAEAPVEAGLPAAAPPPGLPAEGALAGEAGALMGGEPPLLQ
jgi:hypothetical protein